MKRRSFLTSIVMSLVLVAGLGSGVAGPASAATAIQPGARISSGNASCTMNFIYREVLPQQPGRSAARRALRPAAAPQPRLFAGTAAHCVSGVGARVANRDMTFGTVAFHRLSDEAGEDFAFIEIDRDKEHLVNPKMLGFEGPSGVIAGQEARSGDAVHVYGQGLGVGQTELTRPRSGILNRANSKRFDATLPVIFGDSGGPVLHEDGSALGLVVHLVVLRNGTTTLDGNTVEYTLNEARADGLNLELVRG